MSDGPHLTTGSFDPQMRWGWRTVRPDFTSSRGFRWPYPGQWAQATGPILDHNDPCPREPGDGLCVAHTWRGAGSGGVSARNPILVVGWLPADELGRDSNKARIRRGYVADVWSAEKILSAAAGTYLACANLAGAYLAGANLAGADLTGAYLAGANLPGANLAGADLTGAYLTGAYLPGANLAGADLTGADLYRADLTDADLTGADLTGADLTGAYPWEIYE